MLKIVELRCEYLHNPLCIDACQPRLSWKLQSDLRGVMQKSYHVTAFSQGELIWDSGVVDSGESVHVSYGGQALSSRQRVSWQVEVEATDENGLTERARSGAADFEMGLLSPGDWKAGWIEAEKEVVPEARKPALYLRRRFTVRHGLVSARIYQTAHGLYRFWLNGREGTEDRFLPGLTSYYHRIQYQGYDITGLLREGENLWAVMLGDGWWRGITGGTVRNNFGYKLHFFGQLELCYDDGTMETVATDEEFRWNTGGLRASDMLMGECYDANQEPSGWKQADFDDSCWEKVHIAKEVPEAKLIASRSVPVREKESFAAQVFIDKSGKTVLDFGQNIAGYVYIRLRGVQKGCTVRLVHGEGLKDGSFSQDNVNHLSIQTEAFQEVSYTASGAQVEEYCPYFAVFGFRYVCVEGLDYMPGSEDFTARAVYSDMEEIGKFSCSHLLINRLAQNSLWSQKGNFLDVAVDCPTRERNAWTGDAQIYVKTASTFMK